MGISKAEARRMARKRQAAMREGDEAAERAAREAREREQRARELANENDVVDFLQAAAAVDTARARCAAVVDAQEILMGGLITRIADREGGVGRAAKLLDLTVHRARALQRMAGSSEASPSAHTLDKTTGRLDEQVSSGDGDVAPIEGVTSTSTATWNGGEGQSAFDQSA